MVRMCVSIASCARLRSALGAIFARQTHGIPLQNSDGALGNFVIQVEVTQQITRLLGSLRKIPYGEALRQNI